MCRDLFEQMLANVLHRDPDGMPLGPFQKTIIFCAADRHADLVAAEMNNLRSAVVHGQRCRGASTPTPSNARFCRRQRLHPRFSRLGSYPLRGQYRRIADHGRRCASRPQHRFFKYVGSPIAFYQMLGRGTRIDEHTGKLVFTIYDYTGATRLLGESFVTRPTPPGSR